MYLYRKPQKPRNATKFLCIFLMHHSFGILQIDNTNFQGHIDWQCNATCACNGACRGARSSNNNNNDNDDNDEDDDDNNDDDNDDNNNDNDNNDTAKLEHNRRRCYTFHLRFLWVFSNHSLPCIQNFEGI